MANPFAQPTIAELGLPGRGFSRTKRLSQLRKWIKKAPRESKVGAAMVAAVVFVAIAAPLITPYNPDTPNLLASMTGPSLAHWMGTDFVGRDVWSRVLYGTRVDLMVVFLVTGISVAVGTIVGVISGFFGRWVDTMLSRIVDTAIALPFIVVVLAVVAVTGVGLFGVCLGIVLIDWSVYARISRAEMLALREKEFILAARALGFRNLRIIWRHVIPNVLQPCLTFATIDLVANLVAIAAMSYLGFGAQPPTPELGSIVASGQPYLLTAWWISTLPVLVLAMFGIGVGLIGDGLTGSEYKGMLGR
jgi:peptide/nickel transport system permease protein